jgi:hypothetical protein
MPTRPERTLFTTSGVSIDRSHNGKFETRHDATMLSITGWMK